jgi:hypothetical protein
LVERYGKTGDQLPKASRGVFSVVAIRSNALKLADAKGNKRTIPLNTSSLLDYDGETLIVYNPGMRDLNEKEKAVMDEWKKVQTAYLSTHTHYGLNQVCVDFFQNSRCPWLVGSMEMIRGKRYDCEVGKVVDNRVRGERILMYRVYREG